MSIHIEKGDITKYGVDCIVNAANRALIPGDGVDGAINKAAGPKLAEAMKIAKKFLGDHEHATPTGAFGALKENGVRVIIHAVAPDARHVDAETALKQLRQTYKDVFKTAVNQGVHSIAIPCLGVGVYANPMDSSAKIMLEETKLFLKHNPGVQVYLVAFDDKNLDALKAANKAE